MIYFWWLRSANFANQNNAYHVNSDGDWNYNYASNDFGAPL